MFYDIYMVVMIGTEPIQGVDMLRLSLWFSLVVIFVSFMARRGDSLCEKKGMVALLGVDRVVRVLLGRRGPSGREVNIDRGL